MIQNVNLREFLKNLSIRRRIGFTFLLLIGTVIFFGAVSGSTIIILINAANKADSAASISQLFNQASIDLKNYNISKGRTYSINVKNYINRSRKILEPFSRSTDENEAGDLNKLFADYEFQFNQYVAVEDQLASISSEMEKITKNLASEILGEQTVDNAPFSFFDSKKMLESLISIQAAEQRLFSEDDALSIEPFKAPLSEIVSRSQRIRAMSPVFSVQIAAFRTKSLAENYQTTLEKIISVKRSEHALKADLENLALRISTICERTYKEQRNTVHVLGIFSAIQFFFFISAILLLGFYLTRHLSSYVTKPLMRFVNAADTIAKGDYTIRTGIASNDELGALSASFDLMARSMEQTTDELKVSMNKIEQYSKEIEVAEKRYRGIFEKASEGIFRIRKDGTFVVVNNSFAALFDAASADAFNSDGGTFYEIVFADTDERNRFEAILEREKEINNFELCSFGKNNQERYLSINAHITEEDGEEYIEGTLTDISANREAENLRIANEISQQSAKVKSDFFAAISHEIRTPMSAIIGFTSLALKSEMPQRIRDYISKIEVSGRMLLQIINDILDYSKLESGKMSIEQVPFRFDEIFIHLSNILGFKADEKSLELILDISPQIPLLLIGDPLRLEQILINLAGNAIKFTEKGEVSIKAQLIDLLPGSVRISIAVSDTGIGISEEEISSLFSNYSQADNSIARLYGGTGLGLSISRQLVEMMGGEISVISTPGKGSTFTVNLRFALDTNIQKQPLYELDLSHLNILIVEDNPHAAELLSSLLVSFNAAPVTADSADKAFSMITGDTKKRYDLIITDYRMPGMNGIDFARTLHRSILGEPPLILMVTATNIESIEAEAIHAGVSRLIQKPVTRSALYELLMEMTQPKPSYNQHSPIKATAPIERMRNFSGIKVLVADDNEINREIMNEYLTGANAQLNVASNGDECVSLAVSGNYDIIFMDIEMPGTDGYTAAHAIRNAGLDLPIIALSAHSRKDEQQRSLEAGFNDFITKPAGQEQILSMIERWIEHTDQPPQNSTDTAKSASKTEQSCIVIPPIDGIESMRVKEKFGKRPEFYFMLLGKFWDRCKEEITAIDEADITALRKRLHSMKGVAGAVCAEDLSRIASAYSASLDSLDEKAASSNHKKYVAELKKLNRSFGKIKDLINNCRSE